MSLYEYIVKIRVHLLLGLLIILFPILIIVAATYSLINWIWPCKKRKNIAGDIAVVTGGGHGLGRCIALQLAKEGCDVAIADINLEGAEETAKMIRNLYPVKAKAYKTDVTKPMEVEELNKTITADLGSATILVNNAAILVLSNFVKPSYEEIQRAINVNLTAHFWTTSIFLENMKKLRKGHIIEISSISGLMPLVYNSIYVATKFGVHGLMRTLRLDLKTNELDFIDTTTAFPYFLKTNTEVIQYFQQLGFENLYPFITGESAARTIVNAALHKELEVTLPNMLTFVSRIFNILPAAWQDTFWLLTAHGPVKKWKVLYKQQEQEIDIKLNK